MKIYTYAFDFEQENQKELIDLWASSWSKQGFHPIVLGVQDAEQHPLYKSFVEKINFFWNKLLDKDVDTYNLNCYTRWLAYATQPEEKFYVSDYDAINSSFSPIDPDNKLHLMGGHCPFFASGTSSQFDNLCKLFIEITEKNMQELLLEFDQNPSGSKVYSDQGFFLYNMSHLLLRDDIKITNNMDIGHMFDPDKNCAVNHNCVELYPKEECKVYHISFKNTTYLKANYNQYSVLSPYILKNTVATKLIKGS